MINLSVKTTFKVKSFIFYGMFEATVEDTQTFVFIIQLFLAFVFHDKSGKSACFLEKNLNHIRMFAFNFRKVRIDFRAV